MREQILAKVEESFKKAESFYGKKFSRPTNIIFKNNGTCAGRAYHHPDPSKRFLEFQLELAKQNAEDFLENTVPHEVAHYIQFEQYGYINNKPHGRQWKYVMVNVMGIAPDRCHTYDTSSIKKRQVSRDYEYLCNCTIHFCTSILHKRMQAGQRRRCNRCKGQVVPYTQEHFEKLSQNTQTSILLIKAKRALATLSK